MVEVKPQAGFQHKSVQLALKQGKWFKALEKKRKLTCTQFPTARHFAHHFTFYLYNDKSRH